MRRLGGLAIAGVLVACSTDTFSGGDSGLDGGADTANASDGADGATIAPVTFRAKSVSGGGQASSVTLTKPLAAVTGDLLIAVIATTAATTATPPPGWAEVWQDSNTGCAQFKAIVFKGEVASGDPADYLIPMSTTAAHIGALFVYANGSPSKVQLAQGSSVTNDSTYKLDAIPSTPSGAAVVAGAVTAQPITGGPVGMTDRGSFGGGTGSVYDVTLPTGGGLPMRTFETTNSTCGLVFQLVLGPR